MRIDYLVVLEPDERDRLGAFERRTSDNHFHSNLRVARELERSQTRRNYERQVEFVRFKVHFRLALVH